MPTKIWSSIHNLKKMFFFVVFFFFKVWSPLLRRHLFDHLLWSIFQSSFYTLNPRIVNSIHAHRRRSAQVSWLGISFSNRPAVTVSFCKFVVSFFSRPAVIVSFHFPIVQSFFNRPVQKNKDFAIAGIRTINLRVSRRILTPGTTMPRLCSL